MVVDELDVFCVVLELFVDGGCVEKIVVEVVEKGDDDVGMVVF